MLKETVLGELLVRAGLIDSAGLTRAAAVQEKDGIPLREALGNLGLADEEALATTIAKSLHLEFLGTELPEVLPDVSALLPADFCRKRLVAPLSLQGKSLRVALVDPMDLATTQDLEFRTGKRVIAVVASSTAIQSLI